MFLGHLLGLQIGSLLGGPSEGPGPAPEPPPTLSLAPSFKSSRLVSSRPSLEARMANTVPSIRRKN